MYANFESALYILAIFGALLVYQRVCFALLWVFVWLVWFLFVLFLLFLTNNVCTYPQVLPSFIWAPLVFSLSTQAILTIPKLNTKSIQ